VAEAVVVVGWEPLRTLQVVAPAEQQEGKKVTVPVELVSQGDVGGMNLLLRYEAEYLKDPWVSWSSLVGASANTVNTNVAGEVRATFSLGGTALPAGTQLVANVTFRARSVPAALETRLTPVVDSIGDALGNKLLFGTDALGADARILPRRMRGDNNANDRLDIGDATLIQRLLTHLDPVRAWDVTGNDLNQTEDLDDGDVTKVLRVVVGLDVQPPVGPQSSVGQVGSVRRIGLMGTGAATNEGALLLPAAFSAQVGQTVTVQMVLTNVPGQLAGATFTVTYPVEALALTAGGCRVGALVPPTGVAVLWNTNQAGKVSLALSGATAWPQANGVLAELTFQVLAGAAAQAQWPVQLTGVEVTPDGYDNRVLAAVGAVLGAGEIAPPVIDLGKSGMTGQGFRVVFGSQAGVRYELQRSEDLAHWSKVNVLSGTGGELEFLDATALGRRAGFYRIKATR
jgi:hypothetical protein